MASASETKVAQLTANPLANYEAYEAKYEHGVASEKPSFAVARQWARSNLPHRVPDDATAQVAEVRAAGPPMALRDAIFGFAGNSLQARGNDATAALPGPVHRAASHRPPPSSPGRDRRTTLRRVVRAGRSNRIPLCSIRRGGARSSLSPPASASARQQLKISGAPRVRGTRVWRCRPAPRSQGLRHWCRAVLQHADFLGLRAARLWPGVCPSCRHARAKGSLLTPVARDGSFL